MFFVLMIEWSKTIDEFYRYLDKNLPYDIRKNEGGRIVYMSDDFTVSLNLSEMTLKFMQEDYNMNINICVWFDIFTNTNWAEQLLRFVGKYLSEHKGGCVLQETGGLPVLIRRSNQIIVDDSMMIGTGLPFDELGIEYQRGNL